MIKIDKSYTIKYSKAGVRQYADFNEKDGVIVSKSFNPSWVKISEVPSLDNANTIDEILEIIKEFSYDTAEIYLINGQLPKYYRNKKLKSDIKARIKIVDEIIAKQCTEFLIKNVVPILIKNKWFIGYSWCGKPIVIYKNRKGEWDNVRDNKLQYLEYICYVLISGFGLSDDNIDFRREHSEPIIDGFSHLIKYVPEDELNKTNLVINVE